MARNCSPLLIALILICGLAAGSKAARHRPGGTRSALSLDTIQPGARPFNVLSYRLTLDWRSLLSSTHDRHFTGTNIVTLQLTDTTSGVDLDADEMQILGVSVNGTALTTIPQPHTGHLWIPLPSALQNNGDLITLSIHYQRTSDANDGLYFYPKHTYVGRDPFGPDSIFTEEDLAFTMSEPLDAHKWMPCLDLPYDKANSQISITVPSGYSAQSNGTLQSVDSNEDGSHTYNWKSDEPIATYLMVADASRFIEWGDYYHRVSNPNDSVPVIYFAWPADYNQTQVTDGTKYNPRYALRNTPKMLAAFSRLVGEFPFKEYGQVPAAPFSFGGMEHQTMTTINRAWFRGFDEDGIAHELFHQWFGDKTTCETWADIWLNEGFATFGEALWEEAEHGEAAYLNSVEDKARAFLYLASGGVNTIPVYNPPINNVFNYPTTYAKPGCMLHMLRRFVANDTMFFNTLKEYSNHFAYSTANTAQFADFIQSRIGANFPIKLTDFIQEWIYQPDYPIYNIQWTETKDHVVEIEVDQTQSATDHYQMPLRFTAYAGGTATPITMIDTMRSQIFTVPVSAALDSLVFDDEAVIISEWNLNYVPQLAVGTAASPERGVLRVIYEPGFTKLSFAPVVSQSAAIHIVDALGRTVLDLPLVPGAASAEIYAGDLASGNYFVVLRDGAREERTKLRLMR